MPYNAIWHSKQASVFRTTRPDFEDGGLEQGVQVQWHGACIIGMQCNAAFSGVCHMGLMHTVILEVLVLSPMAT